MFNLKQFFKKLKLEKEEREANPVSGFNAIEKFKQDIIPKIKSIGRGITAVAKSPFQIVEKKPERFTFETEQDFAERTKNIEPFKDKGLPETQASQFIKSAGARLPEELINWLACVSGNPLSLKGSMFLVLSAKSCSVSKVNLSGFFSTI